MRYWPPQHWPRRRRSGGRGERRRLPTTECAGRARRSQYQPDSRSRLGAGRLITAGRWADRGRGVGRLAPGPRTDGARVVVIAKSEPDLAERDAQGGARARRRTKGALGNSRYSRCLGRLAADGESHRYAAGCSARRKRFGGASAPFGSRSTTPTTSGPSRRFVTPWASKTSTKRGPKGPAYRSTKRSPTCGGAAGNANVRPAAGHPSPRPSATLSRLVADGLANNEIAARLLVSQHTVQTHLTHVYAKLDIGSRVQLAQEVAGRGEPWTGSPPKALYLTGFCSGLFR